MKSQAKQIIVLFTLLVVGTFFLFFGLSKAQAFLAPLTIAVLLALLMIPLSNKLELWGISRAWAAFISDLILLAFFAGLFYLVSIQVQNVAKDWPQMKEKLKPKIEQLQKFVAAHTPYSVQELNKKIGENIPGGTKENKATEGNKSSASSQSKGVGGVLGSAIMSFFSFLGSTLLTFVYVFFFLLYRNKFKLSILQFIPEEKREEGVKIIKESSKISQNYLLGKLVLIILLAILYIIGLSVSGIKHAILISILAAVLSLIPYIGNIIGYGLGVSMAMFAGGDSTALLGVTITFGIAQFVESYVLEPYIVGDRVDLHPVFTIIAVVLGGAVFGVVGMIIAIPVFGIIKVICDHVKTLNPVGYLLGDQKEEEKNDSNFLNKIYKKFKRERNS